MAEGSELIIQNALDELPECTACGACCHSDTPYYIQIFEHDLQRFGDHARGFMQVDERARSMRFEDGVCSALDTSSPGCTVCRIYTQRPDACRWLERGSKTCRDMIEAHRKGRAAQEKGVSS